jgi:hypothetical protein
VSKESMVIRQKMVDYALWAVAHKDQIAYQEVRPIPEAVPVEHLPFTTDCSGFVTLMAKWAGAPDPNGLNYDGAGYTGSLLTHLTHIKRADSWRADLVVFGGGTGTHVVMLIEGGIRVSNPRVVSHGGKDDPSLYHLSDLIDYFGHSCPLTFLRTVAN